MRFIDLTNQKYNSLLVLERIPNTSPIKWHCLCDCGNECIVKCAYIRNGHTKSCGCLQKQKTAEMGRNNSKNLSGLKFNSLLVLEPSEQRSGSAIKWKCKCDCGKIHYVATGDLTQNKVKSCGCKQYNKEQLIIPMIGKIFGKLTVIQQASKDDDGSYNYLCKCECGQQKVVNGVSLRKGTTTSCGCINYSIGERKIASILEEANIEYIKEYVIQELGNKRFDFALIENNNVIRLIEFDGRQHYESYPEAWEKQCNLQTRQERDKEKNEYALSHNIPLVRIPYWERDKITLEMILGSTYEVREAGQPTG